MAEWEGLSKAAFLVVQAHSFTSNPRALRTYREPGSVWTLQLLVFGLCPARNSKEGVERRQKGLTGEE